METRLRRLGVLIAVIGVAFVLMGIYAFTQVQVGYASLGAFSDAQNVTLSYDENGNLVDRGTTEGAEAIMNLLTQEWGYSVKAGDLDPNDPVINTPTEYMYQMATIGYHVLHGTQTIVLDETVEYNGEVFLKGEHEFNVDGRYWTEFDREHPLEGPARAMAWSPTAHGLIAELGVGAVTASALELGRAVSLILFALGGSFALMGAGFVWAAREVPVAAPTRRLVGDAMPA